MSADNLEDIYPLAPLQQGMLYHCLLSEDSELYVIQIVYRIQGELDLDRFEAAWKQTIARHAVLRTGFFTEGLDEPMQVVKRDVPFQIHRLDWRGVSAESVETNLASFLKSELKRGFDLTDSPLMRLSVIQLGPREFRMVWLYHHLILDGWSKSILFQEVMRFYEVLGRAKEIADMLPAPHFRDYVGWCLAENERSDIEKFWRGLFEGFQNPTALGLERPGSLQERGLEREVSLVLSESDSQALVECARRTQVSLNTVCLGAWLVLLRRYSGDEAVTTGYVLSTRPAKISGVEQMAGVLINTLPLRATVSEEERVADYLHRLQLLQAEVREREFTPLARIQTWSGVERGSALFLNAFVFENFPEDRFRDEKLGIEITREQGRQTTELPLSLILFPHHQIRIQLSFNEALYTEEIVRQLLGHYSSLLESIARHREGQVRDLSLLREHERQQVLEVFQPKPLETADPVCLHEAFSRQAARSPHRPAVRCGALCWSYAELDRFSDEIARRLLGMGLKPGFRAVFGVERSVYALAGLFGVLKAGGTYVPVDPGYPWDRVRFILEDVEAEVLVTSSGLVGKGWNKAPRTLCVDRLEPVTINEDAPMKLPRTDPEQWAYIIYTSGSTGKPKGVLVNHRNAIHSTWARLNYYPESSDVHLVIASFAFDASVAGIFWTLSTGGLLVLPEEGFQQDLESVVKLIEQCKVSNVDSIPSYYAMLLRVGSSEKLSSLRTVIVGGEACPPDLVRSHQAMLPTCSLYNEYGPTETTVWCTVFDATSWNGAGAVPIGKAIQNTSIYLLDGRGEPVPPGVPGEMYVGGAGVAGGYWKHPELTQQRFLPDPFSAKAGARMYRTGDLACMRQDGNIDFLGRKDQQVKIRGYRIELEEIEIALRDHPRVAQAAVVVDSGNGSAARLVAFVVPKSGPEVQDSEWKSFLESRLPEYMVPSHFVLISALPWTTNGKLDVAALRAVFRKAESSQSGSKHTAPRNDIEAQWVELWESLLNRSPIGIHDNFFDLGGHSMLVAQLHVRLREKFGSSPGMRQIFETPTIAELCHLAAQSSGNASTSQDTQAAPASNSASIPRYPRDQSILASFAQEGLWFLDQMQGPASTYNTYTALRLRGSLNEQALESALADLVDRHEVLRTTFAASDQGSTPVQRIQAAINIKIPVKVIAVDGVTEAERENQALALAEQEVRIAFDLIKGPLVRVRCFRLSAEDHLLLATFHHIIADGWSMGVWWREWSELYMARLQKRASALSPLEVQFADYAGWEREQLTAPVLEQELDHWRARLAGAPGLLELPLDRPRPQAPSHRGDRVYRRFTPGQVERWTQIARESGCTLYVLFLAVWKVVISRFAGQTDVVIGSPVSRRSELSLEGLIGYFVNTLPVRTQLNLEHTLRQTLATVRSNVLDVLAHQRFPFDRLVKELNPVRSLSFHPVFQVALAMEQDSGASEVFGGTKATPITLNTAVSRFDMMLWLTARESEVAAALEYSVDLFEASTADRLLGAFEALLNRVADSLDCPLSRLDLFTDAERKTLLALSQPAEVSFAKHLRPIEVFDRLAQSQPQSEAVRFGQTGWSYAQLNQRAEQLAAELASRGVLPGDLVGVCLQRSLDMVAALLGVWKAGAAYVPLDPAYPADRVRLILQDSQARLLISETGLKSLHEGSEVPVLWIDSANDRSRVSTKEQKTVANSVTSPAYVIFTSGSTGRPKGVAVSHRALTNFLESMRKDPGFTAKDALLAVTTISFDIAGLELWLPLTTGGRVVLVDRDSAMDPIRLKDVLKESGATVMQATPVTWRMLLDSGWEGDVRLKILCGGEAMPADLARRLVTRCGELWNMYGPTETTIWSTVFRVGTATRGTPIGTPIANTRVYVVDSQHQLQPRGVPGELWIGGEGVAIGYWNRPDLTSDRFLKDPFVADPNARVYRTGDQVRWNADDQLEYLGRLDFQVKLRGYRIELGEIESVLLRHPQVQSGVVICREDADGGHLVAYYVPQANGSNIEVEELRRWLSQTLPDYMVPRAYCRLESLPLTPNGKVDRKALPRVEATAPLSARTTVAPRTPLEKTLVQIWKKVLGLQEIGVQDNFFSLGGHSLLAVRLFSEIQQSLGKSLSLATLFRAQTVEELAKVLSDSGTDKVVVWNCLVPIQPKGKKPALFCVHAAGGNVLFYRDLALRLGEDQPLYGLQAQGLDGKLPRHDSVEAMAEQYLKEVRNLQPNGPYHIGGSSYGGLIAFEMAQQLLRAGEEVGLIALFDTHGPGYPQRLPGTTPLQAMVYSEFRRLQHHVGALAGLQGKQRWLYVKDKLERSGRVFRRTLEDQQKKLLAKWYMAMGHPLPGALKVTQNSIRLAALKYSPKPFAGKLTLFRATRQPLGIYPNPTLGWSTIAAGGIEVFDVPGTHGAILVEPRVNVLAEKVEQCLSRYSQASQS